MKFTKKVNYIREENIFAIKNKQKIEFYAKIWHVNIKYKE